MSRHNYPLRDETVKTLTGNCPAIADEWGVSPSYVYGILEGTNPDPFSYFLELYKATVAAGVSTEHYDAKLAEVKARYRQGENLRKSLSQKMHEEGSTNSLINDALADGQIDDAEKGPLLRAIDAERETLNRMEAEIVGNVADLKEHARKAVGGRRG